MRNDGTAVSAKRDGQPPVSPRSARELRKIVNRSCAVWNLPTPPYDAAGR
jgi:hypothetical protein